MRMRLRSSLALLLVAGCYVPSVGAQELVRLAELPADTQVSSVLSHRLAEAPPPAASPVQAWDSAAAPAPACDAGGACDSACCYDFNVCCTPCVYGYADALFWHRVGTGCSETLVVNTGTGDPLLSTDDLDFNLTGGARFTIGWQPDPAVCSRCCAWELSYFGIFDWNADAVVTGAGDLAIPGDLGLASNNFFNADILGIDYTSNMHNLELNCIKSCCVDDCLRLDFLCGFRYISLDEDFVITGTDFDEGTSDYAVNADNDLFGVQLGGRLRRAYCSWAVELTGKAGVFYNDAHQSQLVTDFPDTPTAFVLRDTTANGDGVAMLGEIGVVLIRPINDSWNFRIGYNVMGVGGLVLASNQIDFTDTPASGLDTNNDGWFFAHGGIVGVESRW